MQSVRQSCLVPLVPPPRKPFPLLQIETVYSTTALSAGSSAPPGSVPVLPPPSFLVPLRPIAEASARRGRSVLPAPFPAKTVTWPPHKDQSSHQASVAPVRLPPSL